MSKVKRRDFLRAAASCAAAVGIAPALAFVDHPRLRGMTKLSGMVDEVSWSPASFDQCISRTQRGDLDAVFIGVDLGRRDVTAVSVVRWDREAGMLVVEVECEPVILPSLAEIKFEVPA